MLARLETQVAEQQRFAANASHELRTPLAITQTLLDVARNDPNHDNGELVDRLHFVNTRAIDLTEALLLLSRADQRSFTPEHVDLSLLAEEATEALLPLAEKRGLTIETSGDITPTIGSPALLLQMTTNLVHNAIVHNLPEQGTVWVTHQRSPQERGAHGREHRRAAHPTAGRHACRAVSARLQAHTHRSRRCRPRPSHRQEHRRCPRRNPHPHPPVRWRAFASRCSYPPLHRRLVDDRRAQPWRSRRFLPASTNVHPGGGLDARTPGVLTMHATSDSTEWESRAGSTGRWTDGQLRAGVSRRSTRRRSRSLAARARTWGSCRGSKASACRAGFCVTTDAFRRIMADAPSIDDRLDRLSRLDPDDREAIRTLSAEIRRAIEGIAIPDDLAAAITRSVARLGEQAAYAVRSSATAEDLPTASFAGQQDTYLNVVGPAAILEHVSRCWASLFTERAVTYRLRNGFDHRKVHMAVVVQQMVFPQAAGVLFTADPVTSNRKVVSVEASFGLGEALVSGLVNADVYQVRDGEIVAKAIATKQLAIHASPAGGTQERGDRAGAPGAAGADRRAGRASWRSWAGGSKRTSAAPRTSSGAWSTTSFQIVQSRPITTLFPIPAAGDEENHVYVSVGHQQMMTDAMKPLGLSLWQLTTPRPMSEAGGRLFVDVAPDLASPASRAGLLEVMGRSDPLIGDALQTILERGDFIPTLPDEGPACGARRRQRPPRSRPIRPSSPS